MLMDIMRASRMDRVETAARTKASLNTPWFISGTRLQPRSAKEIGMPLQKSPF
jgi:hypothetical protein